jgi:hypothetical protein
MLPLTQPPASFQEPLSNEAGALRNRLSRPKALEGRDGSVGQLGKMPINNLHVRNAGVQSKEAILCGPGGVGVNQFLDPVLGECSLGAGLETREFYTKIERSRRKNKPVRRESL